MKVLLRRNVSKLGKIGELVEVKDGYARNYLLPHRLAVEPTKGNLKAVESEKAAYLAEMAARKSEFEARAAQLQGKEVTISARANEEGSLYGSIGPAQIVAALAGEKMFVDEESIELDAPIRRLDKYEVKIVFSEDVFATVVVWVVPIREAILEGEAPAAEVKAEGEEPKEAAEE